MGPAKHSFQQEQTKDCQPFSQTPLSVQFCVPVSTKIYIIISFGTLYLSSGTVFFFFVSSFVEIFLKFSGRASRDQNYLHFFFIFGVFRILILKIL